MRRGEGLHRPTGAANERFQGLADRAVIPNDINSYTGSRSAGTAAQWDTLPIRRRAEACFPSVCSNTCGKIGVLDDLKSFRDVFAIIDLTPRSDSDE